MKSLWQRGGIQGAKLAGGKDGTALNVAALPYCCVNAFSIPASTNGAITA